MRDCCLPLIFLLAALLLVRVWAGSAPPPPPTPRPTPTPTPTTPPRPTPTSRRTPRAPTPVPTPARPPAIAGLDPVLPESPFFLTLHEEIHYDEALSVPAWERKDSPLPHAALIVAEDVQLPAGVLLCRSLVLDTVLLRLYGAHANYREPLNTTIWVFPGLLSGAFNESAAVAKFTYTKPSEGVWDVTDPISLGYNRNNGTGLVYHVETYRYVLPNLILRSDNTYWVAVQITSERAYNASDFTQNQPRWILTTTVDNASVSEPQGSPSEFYVVDRYHSFYRTTPNIGSWSRASAVESTVLPIIVTNRPNASQSHRLAFTVYGGQCTTLTAVDARRYHETLPPRRVYPSFYQSPASEEGPTPSETSPAPPAVVEEPSPTEPVPEGGGGGETEVSPVSGSSPSTTLETPSLVPPPPSPRTPSPTSVRLGSTPSPPKRVPTPKPIAPTPPSSWTPSTQETEDAVPSPSDMANVQQPPPVGATADSNTTLLILALVCGVLLLVVVVGGITMGFLCWRRRHLHGDDYMTVAAPDPSTIELSDRDVDLDEEDGEDDSLEPPPLYKDKETVAEAIGQYNRAVMDYVPLDVEQPAPPVSSSAAAETPGKGKGKAKGKGKKGA